MNRYRTIGAYDGTIIAQTEAEFEACKDVDRAMDNESGVADWVWQFAESKEQALSQHNKKVDEWAANPYQETY